MPSGTAIRSSAPVLKTTFPHAPCAADRPVSTTYQLSELAPMHHHAHGWRRRSGIAINTIIASAQHAMVAFSVVFFAVVVPGIWPNTDFVQQALLDGYVNATAAGYTTDTLACACVLATWVVYERFTLGVCGGWVALVVSLVPGVAVGFAAYLLIRRRSLSSPRA